MKMRGMIVTAVAVGLVSSWCAWADEEKDEVVTMSQVPEKVQKAIKQYASESEVKKIEKGDVDGKMAYEFEIEKGGKKSEVTLLPNGKLLSTEEEIALADIPEAAQKTINNAAAGGKLVSTEKVFEKGKTAYEAVIEKGGKKVEITVATNGKVVATEAVKEAKLDKSWEPTLLPQEEMMSSIGRNRFFILEPGHQLVFQGKEGRKTVDLVITVLDETKLVDGVETRIVEERESANGQLVEVSRNYFAVGAQSHNVYYFGEDVDMYKNGKIASHEGAWLAGVGGAKHGIAMPAENKVGDRYYQEQAPKVAQDRAETVSLAEAVETPAGAFEHCLKVKETTPLEPGTGYKWYAPDVGLVADGDLKLVRHGFVKKGN